MNWPHFVSIFPEIHFAYISFWGFCGLTCAEDLVQKSKRKWLPTCSTHNSHETEELQIFPAPGEISDFRKQKCIFGFHCEFFWISRWFFLDFSVTNSWISWRIFTIQSPHHCVGHTEGAKDEVKQAANLSLKYFPYGLTLNNQRFLRLLDPSARRAQMRMSYLMSPWFVRMVKQGCDRWTDEPLF